MSVNIDSLIFLGVLTGLEDSSSLGTEPVSAVQTNRLMYDGQGFEKEEEEEEEAESSTVRQILDVAVPRSGEGGGGPTSFVVDNKSHSVTVVHCTKRLITS